jgi:hypothetical protein
MNRLHFLKRGLRPSCVSLCALSFIFFELSGSACFAGVLYEYRAAGSATVIGTIAIQAPPASASSSWSTADASDLLALFLDNAVFGLGSGSVLSLGGTVGFSGMSSLHGARLDGGGIGITFPTIVPSDPRDPTIDQSLSIQFAVPQGGDFIGLATVTTFPNGDVVVGDLFLFGDWVAVPEPNPVTLLGVSLFGVGWMGYRKRRRSVHS